MTLEYIPRKQVAEHLESGWRLIPSHTYSPGEYAILMARPTYPEPLTVAQIMVIVAKLEHPLPAPKIPRCKRGHYLTGDNLYVRHDGRGGCCRLCMKRADKARKAKARKAIGVPA